MANHDDKKKKCKQYSVSAGKILIGASLMAIGKLWCLIYNILWLWTETGQPETAVPD